MAMGFPHSAHDAFAAAGFARPLPEASQPNGAVLAGLPSASAEAEAIARHWGIDYAALRRDGLADARRMEGDAHVLADALHAARAPGWQVCRSPAGAPRIAYRLTGPGTRH